jgi:hypothetical protein
MEKKYASERTVAVIDEAIDALQRGSEAPESPIKKFHNQQERDELRRLAKRLRKGQIHPPYGNILSGPELADIYELTILRDEIIEAAHKDLRRAIAQLEKLIQEEGAAVNQTFYAMLRDAEEEAIVLGPGSEGARRVPHMNFIIEIARKGESLYRRKSSSDSVHVGPRLTKNPVAAMILAEIFALTAAEIIDSPPDGETLLMFPAEGGDPARGRVLMRIGLGKASWIGSFELGDTEHNTVQLLPDGKHLFVSAGGAGYILDARSRALVERIGNDVVSVGDAFMGSVFIVTHGHRSFEAFGIPGRLWKTGTIGCGGFRGLTFEGEEFVGEARQEGEPEWAAFSVKLLNGEVSFRADRPG